MRVLVTGATGTAGSAVVERALEDPEVERVIALVRRPLERRHDKLETVLHQDFLDYGPVAGRLAGLDACLWCLGIAQSKVSKAEYEVITHDYALAAARALAAHSPAATFCFLSGRGADSKEKSIITFARVKGRTENALLALGTPSVYAFRPGYIHPAAARPGRGLGERISGALVPLLRLSRSMVCDAPRLAAAMIHVARHGHEPRVLENADILAVTR